MRRVLIADDHPLILAGIKRALEESDGFEVVAEARVGSQVLPLVSQTNPDLALLDLRMPEMDGLTCLDRIRKEHPQVKVVILSVSTDPEVVQTVLNHGASAYVVKSVNPIDLSSALRQALDGTVFSAVGLPEKTAQDDAVKAAGLTERETTILKALARGLSNEGLILPGRDDGRTDRATRVNQPDASTTSIPGGRKETTLMHPALATVRKPILVTAALGALALALLLILTRAGGPGNAFASSHSEAPLISQDPRADNTDLYAFVSPDSTNTVTMIANYIPLEQPASGPNFYSFDDTVLYEMKIDNTGDGRPDLGYQFRFTTATRNPDTFLYNTGPINSLSDPAWNRPQTYSVTLVHFNKEGKQIGMGKVLGKDIPTPPDNIGPRSTPNYDNLAAAAVTTLPNTGGIKVFAGQRDDPFFVDLGSIFDLAGLRPFNPFHLLPLAAAPGRDALANDNVHSIEIQVPTSQLVSFSSPTIGIYASASRQKVRILDENGTTKGHGPWVQVSRLGNPLINEVVIPLGDKDYWNREDPANDQQFEHYYTAPEVSRLENALYGTLPQGHGGGALQAIDATGRTDLVTILLTGIPGVNFTGSTDSDLLRLNTAITPGSNGACPGGTASSAQPDRLGPLGASGDLCGYPNGRRLGDDVIDIDLRAFAQGYGPFLHTALGLPDKTPNDLLGDGVDTNDVSFSGTFPYVAAPHQGYEVP